MNAAEYRTLREVCGLSARDAAAFHQVAERTIVHWETGRNGIPPGAADELAQLNARIERAVRASVDLYRESAPPDAPDAVALVRYRTARSYADSRAAREGLSHASHNALIARMMTALEQAGARVMIDWG
ncbi:helix-turn-helix domain-containing protein [Rhodopila sp.]|uniref:helix-turn-helix domain-containing protein n=1 Tax=Rhodopila sp. TaxID=2480087 RepID=UPI003D141355